MTTSQPPGLELSADRPAFGHYRRRRRTRAGIPPSRRRAAGAVQSTSAVQTITRDVEHVRATWASENGRFELVVRSNAAGLQVKLCTCFHSGAALEEGFVIRSLADFEQWLGNAPTKFDHPVAHEEVRRLAHGTLLR
jgi:hypothetical protein